jgi:nucleoside 2-deoxyribosyltransferase
MCTYNSPIEDRELAVIHREFPNYEIVNPGTYEENKEKAESKEMEYCKYLVSTCDALIFSRLFGQVTSGVGIEIEHALSLGKPVFELANGKTRQVRKPAAYITREETNILSARWRRENLSYRRVAFQRPASSTVSGLKAPR